MICTCCERTYLYQNQYSYKYQPPCSNAVLGYILKRRAIHQTCLCKKFVARVYFAAPLVYFVVLGQELGGNVALAVYPPELRVVL